MTKQSHLHDKDSHWKNWRFGIPSFLADLGLSSNKPSNDSTQESTSVNQIQSNDSTIQSHSNEQLAVY